MDRRRAAGALLALAACIACSAAAPTASNQTALDLYEGAPEGCYYNFQHYGEGDRIMTNEPCLNCTCHNRMLMCYLRVCPFTKAIGQDCTVEKRADQCCPIVTCPDVPVDLLTSTSTTSPAEYGATGLGKLDKYGCSINGKYFSEGSKVPPTPNKPCEHCYCIRNMTTCVMQECTLHVDGCTPIYHKDVCCPVRYSCDHPEDEVPLLDDMSTTVRPTPGFLLTTTTVAPVMQMTQDCVHDDQIFADGALIKTEKACEHCYCMKGDIVCVVQECGAPMENEGKNCTSLPPREGQCCPDTYICEGDELSSDLPIESTTDLFIEKLTTLSPPRRAGVEGSGYRNEPDEAPYTEMSTIESEQEGSGEEQEIFKPLEPEEIIPVSEDGDQYISVTTKAPIYEERGPTTTEVNKIIKPDLEEETVEPHVYHSTTNAPVEEEVEKLTTSNVPDEKYLEPHEHVPATSAPESYDKETTESVDSLNTVPDVIPEKEITKSHDLPQSTTSVPPIEGSEGLSSIEGDEIKTTFSEKEKDVTISALEEPSQPDYSTPNSNTDEYEKPTVTYEMSNVTPGVTEKDNAIESEITGTTNAIAIEESATLAPQKSEEEESSKPQEFIPITTSYPLEEGQKLTTEPDHAQNTVAVAEEESTQTHLHVPTATIGLTLAEEEKTTISNLEQDTVTDKIIEEDALPILGHVPTAAPSLVETEYTTAEPDKELNTIPSEMIEETSSEPSESQKTTLFLETKATESSATTDEMLIQDVDTKPTSISGAGTLSPESIITKGDQYTITTEPSFRKEDEISVSTEKQKEFEPTTIKAEFVDEGLIPTSPHDEKFGSDSDIPFIEEDITTIIPEYTKAIEEKLGTKQTTTESILDASVAIESLPDIVPKPSSEKEGKLPTSTEKIAEVTPIAPEDLETHEEASRIPGEGDCLLNGVTYRNNTIVPSTNICHTGCRCASSIIKCDPIICSPPPDYMDNCQSIYDSPDSCCPTFVCDHPRETVPPQSDNQMSGTESPMQIGDATIECRGDQCEISKPSQQPAETSELCTSGSCSAISDNKPEIECGPEGCGDISHKPEISIPSVERTEECTDAKCIPESCANSECKLPHTQDQKPCEGEHCEKIGGVISLPSPQLCTDEENCKPVKVPVIQATPCEGESCTKLDCKDGSCGSNVISPPQDTQQLCKEDGSCNPQDITVHDCTGDEPCRRKETSSIEEKLPSECEGSNCKHATETMFDQDIYLSTESPKLEESPLDETTENVLTAVEDKATELPESPVLKPEDEVTVPIEDSQETDINRTEGQTDNKISEEDVQKEKPGLIEEEGLEKPSEFNEDDKEEPVVDEDSTIKPVMIIKEDTDKPAVVQEEGPQKPGVSEIEGTEKPAIITEKETEEPTMIDEGKQKPTEVNEEETKEPAVFEEEDKEKPASIDENGVQKTGDTTEMSKEKPILIDEEGKVKPADVEEVGTEKPGFIQTEGTEQPAIVLEDDIEKHTMIDEDGKGKPTFVEENGTEQPSLIDKESEEKPAVIEEKNTEKPTVIQDGMEIAAEVDEESKKEPTVIEAEGTEKPIIIQEGTEKPTAVDDEGKEKPALVEEGGTDKPSLIGEDGEEKPVLVEEGDIKKPALTAETGEEQPAVIEEEFTEQPAVIQEGPDKPVIGGEEGKKKPTLIKEEGTEKPYLFNEKDREQSTVIEEEGTERPAIVQEGTEKPAEVDEGGKKKPILVQEGTEIPTFTVEESGKQPDAIEEEGTENPDIIQEGTEKPAKVEDKEKPSMFEGGTEKPTLTDMEGAEQPGITEDEGTEKPIVSQKGTEGPAKFDEEGKEKPVLVEGGTEEPTLIDEEVKEIPALVEEVSTEKPSFIEREGTEQPTIVQKEDIEKPDMIDESDKKEPTIVEEESTDKPSVIEEEGLKKPIVVDEGSKLQPNVIEGDYTETPIAAEEGKETVNLDSKGTEKPVDLEDKLKPAVTKEGTEKPTLIDEEGEEQLAVNQEGTENPAELDEGKGTENPTLIDEESEKQPAVTKDMGSEKPIIQEGTEKPALVFDEGKEKPTLAEVGGTENPTLIDEEGEKQPAIIKEMGSEKPIIQEGTEKPALVFEEGNEKPVLDIIDDDGKGRPAVDEQESSENPVMIDEEGTVKPDIIEVESTEKSAMVDEVSKDKPAVVDEEGAGQPGIIEEEVTENPVLSQEGTEGPTKIDYEGEEKPELVKEGGTEKPTVVEEPMKIPADVDEESTEKPALIMGEGTETPAMEAEEVSKKPVMIDEEGKQKPAEIDEEMPKMPVDVGEGNQEPAGIEEDGVEKPHTTEEKGTETPLIEREGMKKPVVVEDGGTEKPQTQEEEGSGVEIPEIHSAETEKEIEPPEIQVQPTESVVTEIEKETKMPIDISTPTENIVHAYSTEPNAVEAVDVSTSPQDTLPSETPEIKVTESQDDASKVTVMLDHSQTPEIRTESLIEQELTTKTPLPATIYEDTVTRAPEGGKETISVSEVTEQSVQATSPKADITDVNEEGSTVGQNGVIDEAMLGTKAPALQEMTESLEKVTKITDTTISAHEEVFTYSPELELLTTKTPEAGPVVIVPEEGAEPDKPELLVTDRIVEESTTKVYEKEQNKPLPESHVTEVTKVQTIIPGYDRTTTLPEITETYDRVSEIPELIDEDKQKPESPELYGTEPEKSATQVPVDIKEEELKTDQPEIYSPNKNEIITEAPVYSVTEPVRTFTEIEDSLVTGLKDITTSYPEESTEHHYLPIVTDKIDASLVTEKPLPIDIGSPELPEVTSESDKPSDGVPEQITETPEAEKEKPDVFESPATEILIDVVTDSEKTSHVPEKSVTSYEEMTTSSPDLSDQTHKGTILPEGSIEEHEAGTEIPQYHVTVSEEQSKATETYITDQNVTEALETSTKSVVLELADTEIETTDISKPSVKEETETKSPDTDLHDLGIKEQSVTEIQKPSTELPTSLEDLQTELPGEHVTSEVPQSLITEQPVKVGVETTVSNIPKEGSSQEPELLTTQFQEMTRAPELHTFGLEDIRTETPVYVPEFIEPGTKQPDVTEQEDKVTKIPEEAVTEKQDTVTTLRETATVPQEEITEKPEADMKLPELTTIKQIQEVTKPTEQTSAQAEFSETTPYLIELEEHTHKIVKDVTTVSPSEDETLKSTEDITTSSPLEEHTYNIVEHLSTLSPSNEERTTAHSEAGQKPQVSEITTKKTDEGTGTAIKVSEEATSRPSEESAPEDVAEKITESLIPVEASTAAVQEVDNKYDVNHKEYTTIAPTQISVESTPAVITDFEKSPISELDIMVPTEKESSGTEKPLHPIVPHETTAGNEFIYSTTKATTVRQEEDIMTSISDDKFAKPEVIPSEASEITPPSTTAEVPKPGISDMQPTDEIPAPEEEGHFPPSGTSGYGEPDYVEEDQAFGPGTCRYGGKVYVSAQQIPRDDPCDFCFCFRSDIICLQQSCPPPIHGCHEEPIQGFCCPRYECPVSMATTVNVTTTTTTTTTTLPPHFPTHSYKGAAQRRGCQIKGHTYKVGEVVRSSSGPCLHCTCGGDGQMKCDPKACTPEPMLRQMIAAAVSAKRRR